MSPVSGFFILYLVFFNLNMSVQKGVHLCTELKESKNKYVYINLCGKYMKYEL